MFGLSKPLAIAKDLLPDVEPAAVPVGAPTAAAAKTPVGDVAKADPSPADLTTEKVSRSRGIRTMKI